MKHFFCLLGGLAFAIAPSTLQAQQVEWAAGAPNGTPGGSVIFTPGEGQFLDTGISAFLVGGDKTDVDLDGFPDNGSSYTVSAWISSSENQGDGNARTDRWFFGTRNQGIHLGIRTVPGDDTVDPPIPAVTGVLRHGHWASDTSGTTSVPVNTWTHVAFVFDASANFGTGAVTIYRDGLSEGTTNTNPPNTGNTNLVIGSRDANGNDPGWGGLIDDVAIFTTVLSATDVASLAASGADPVGLGAVAYYNFEDDQAGSTAANLVSVATSGLTDSDGNPSPQELTGIGVPLPPPPPTADWTTGAPGGTSGGALLFDGDNDSFLDLGILATQFGGNRTNPSDYTISAWIRSDVEAVDAGGVGTGLAADNYWWLGTGSQGLHLGVQAGNTLQQGHWSQDSSGVTLVPVNTWVHSTTTFDADGGTPDPVTGVAPGLVTIYYNGVFDSSAEKTGPNRSGSNLILGSRSGGRQSWLGAVDDVALFNTVLTAAQVTDLYTNTDPVALGALAYYDFEDAQSGSTAANAVDVVVSGLTDVDGNPSPQAVGVIEPSGAIKGDCDMNGVVNFSDIPAFISVLQNGMFLAEADCDCNLEVNFSDIPPFIQILQNAP